MARSYGFSLIEVVMAIAIVGIVLVVIGTFLQRIPVNSRDVGYQDLALKIARGEVEHLRAQGYDALPASGSFSDSLLSSLPAGTGAVAITTYDDKTKQVVVTVSYQGAGQTASSVALTTLIAQNSTLP